MLMGMYPEQLADWLSGRVKPYKRNRESINSFFDKNRKLADCFANENFKCLPSPTILFLNLIL